MRTTDVPHLGVVLGSGPARGEAYPMAAEALPTARCTYIARTSQGFDTTAPDPPAPDGTRRSSRSCGNIMGPSKTGQPVYGPGRPGPLRVLESGGRGWKTRPARAASPGGATPMRTTSRRSGVVQPGWATSPRSFAITLTSSTAGARIRRRSLAPARRRQRLYRPTPTAVRRSEPRPAGTDSAERPGARSGHGRARFAMADRWVGFRLQNASTP